MSRSSPPSSACAIRSAVTSPSSHPDLATPSTSSHRDRIDCRQEYRHVGDGAVVSLEATDSLPGEHEPHRRDQHDLAHITLAVDSDWLRPDLPVLGLAPEFAKTCDLVGACPLHRVAHHWLSTVFLSEPFKKGLTASIGASGRWGECGRRDMVEHEPSGFVAPYVPQKAGAVSD